MWGSKREEVAIDNSLCAGLKRKGLWCAGKGQALRGANGLPTASLLSSVLAVLPACFPLFSTHSVPSMEREGSGSPLLRSEMYGMVELGLWNPGKGQTENGIQKRVCVCEETVNNTLLRWRRLVRLYGNVKGNSLREKPGGSVGWCMELRRDSCEMSFGVVIFGVNLSVLLKARISVIIWTGSSNF